MIDGECLAGTANGLRLHAGTTLDGLREAFGGRVVGASGLALRGVRPPSDSGPGDLALLTASRWLEEARAAVRRGATLLVSDELAPRALPFATNASLWIHSFAPWAFARLLGERVAVDETGPTLGEGCIVHNSAVLGPRVVLGRNVRVDAHAVIGRPGFGWAPGPDGKVLAIPQLGGVLVEDDVVIGALSTVDAGTLGPTVLRRGVKLDAHVHVGHNVEIGEGTIVAAQAGFAGSVRIGRGVLVGGQAGFADHVTVGDGARIAAKSGVIGNVAAGATVAGYPAVERHRWLRAWGFLHRAAARSRRAEEGSPP